jgi:hypothetical protein
VVAWEKRARELLRADAFSSKFSGSKMAECGEPEQRLHSARDARHRGLLRLPPKLFVDLHKGAVDGCLGRNARSRMMRRSWRFCPYRIE